MKPGKARNSSKPARGKERDPDASAYPEPGSRPQRNARDTPRSPTRWYTATEVAKLCGVTKSAVTYWARTGKVERVPGRGRWLNFTTSALTRACTLGKITGLVSGYIC